MRTDLASQCPACSLSIITLHKALPCETRGRCFSLGLFSGCWNVGSSGLEDSEGYKRMMWLGGEDSIWTMGVGCECQDGVLSLGAKGCSLFISVVLRYSTQEKNVAKSHFFFFFFPFFSLDNFQGLEVSWVAVWWQLTLWLFQTQSVVGGSPGSVSAGTCWDSCREEEGKKESAELLYFLAVAWVQESWGCSAWGEQPWCLAAAIALCWSVPNTMTALCLGCSCSSLTSIDTLAGNLHGWCTWGLQAGE